MWKPKIPDAMAADARAIRAKGGKCYLVTPDVSAVGDLGLETKDMCPNCNGSGNVGLEIVVGGPYKRVEPTQGDGPHITTIDKDWFKHNLKFYQCPVCYGRGTAHIKPVKPLMLGDKVPA